MIVIFFDVEGCYLILVDDVFYIGWMMCVVFNELFDYGWLVLVVMVVLVDCGGCELLIGVIYCVWDVDLLEG